MNNINIVLILKIIKATKRYLFPLILNIYLSLATISTALNVFFRSLKSFQSAFFVSSYHLNKEFSASGCFLENSLSIVFEMITIFTRGSLAKIEYYSLNQNNIRKTRIIFNRIQ